MKLWLLLKWWRLEAWAWRLRRKIIIKNDGALKVAVAEAKKETRESRIRKASRDIDAHIPHGGSKLRWN